jgi:ubiquinone biosynthesis protein
MLNIHKISAVSKTYRNFKRYRQILAILFKYGFDEIFATLNLDQYIEASLKMLFKKEQENIQKLTRAERVRKILEELGPTFIKFGQVLSSRPDLIPMDYIRELEKLQDEVPPFPFADVVRIIEEELGKPPDQLFKSFNKNVLAAASIGQVHEAVLKDGTAVVLKIQRPKIKKMIEADLEIMFHLAALLEKNLEEFDIQKPTRIVEVFARTIEKEINYNTEAGNIQRFRKQFAKTKTIYIPRVYRKFSTKRVLTMELIKGIKASDIDSLKKAGNDLSEVVRRGSSLYLQQVFVHGFFHADPHAGNIFILPDNVICFLDFGMMGRLTARQRADFADLIIHIVRRNPKKIVDATLKITYYDQEPDRDALEEDLAQFVDEYLYLTLKQLEVGRLLQSLLEIIINHKLHLRPNYFLLIKSATTIEGWAMQLEPDFEMIERARPFFEKYQLSRLNPKKIAADVFESGEDFFDLLREIPGDLRDILKLAKQGRMKIEFEHHGLGVMIATLDRISNRISFAIVLAAQIVGSALVVLADIPPKWNDISVIGLAGFLVAGVMGFWLLVSMLRHGRM